jgi:hypothetical protein
MLSDLLNEKRPRWLLFALFSTKNGPLDFQSLGIPQTPHTLFNSLFLSDKNA